MGWVIGAALAASVIPARAGAQAARAPENPFELRAGAELLLLQGISRTREYSMEEKGAAYGVAAAGLVNAVGPLWVGLGLSYARIESDDSVYAPTGPITGWLLHVPLLVELRFPIEKPESCALVGLELGGLFGGFENIYYSYTSDHTARVRGYFVGLRGGYALSIAEQFAVGGTIGVRGGKVDQTNLDESVVENRDMLYLALVAGLALHFQP
jgi:hypothetical protein